MNDIMKDKAYLIKAIESYDIYKPQGRNILKVLVAIAVENLSTITVSKLIQLSKVSRQGTYNSLKYLENDKMIERIKTSGMRLNCFKLNTNKLSEITRYFQQSKQAESILNIK